MPHRLDLINMIIETGFMSPKRSQQWERNATDGFFFETLKAIVVEKVVGFRPGGVQ